MSTAQGQPQQWIDVTVAVPLCTPTREGITRNVSAQLARYRFQHGGITVTQATESGKPAYWRVNVPFHAQAAAWGEYVLLRFGYVRIGAYVDPKNEAYAQKWLLPESGPWYAKDCKDKPKTQQQPTLSENPLANPPTPWASQPRDWWNHLDGGRTQAQVQKPKRKRGGWFGL